MSEGKTLDTIFIEYACFGMGQQKCSTLDNSKFFKMIKEANLIDDKLTRPDVDIAFQKVREDAMVFTRFR